MPRLLLSVATHDLEALAKHALVSVAGSTYCQRKYGRPPFDRNFYMAIGSNEEVGRTQ